ncbi:MAG: hypothetical protein KAX20_01145 [Candidatus Omnitrophica bacterium]|nr:hypothetical protein [Candidatus Omnitrophota bacterium]
MGRRKRYLIEMMTFLGYLSFACELSGVVAEPGDTDYFVVKTASEVRAGEIFRIEIEARDLHNNLVTDYHERGKEIQIKALGSGEFKPEAIKSTVFKEGKTVIDCSYTKAESLKILFKEKGSSAFGSARLSVVPGKPGYFEPVLPSQARAGERFPVRLIARDVYGNCVTSFGKEEGKIEISSDGKGSINPDHLNSKDFNDGIAGLNLTYTKAEKVTLFFKGKKGISGNETIEIKPGRFHHFEIIPPAEIVAGRPFKTLIKVRDAYDNLLINYDKEGKGAMVNTSGTGLIRPNFIPAASFKEGLISINFIYTKAEPFTIVARERLEKEIIKEIPREEVPGEKIRKDIPPKPEKSVEELKAEAIGYIDADRYDKALETVKRILELEPSSEEIIRLKERLEQIIKLFE